MNIRVNLNTDISDGSEVVFRSPADCSQVTGLVIYHTGGKTEFVFADAHGNNVGDIDHLFAENAVVKVILDVTAGMAFVQNADTNAYIERTFIKSVNGKAPEEGKVELNADDVGALSKEALQDGVNHALQQAKESGAFDGKDGKDYILTDEDKQEIAGLTPVPKGSGIYIGSGDMPEGYDVQIDPEGEPLDLDEFLTEDEVDEAIDKALGSFDGDGLTEKRVNEMISEALENIDLPESGGGIEVSGAKVGDFLKVKEIDEKGVPTAWETAEMPTGGEWKLIRTVTVPEDITTDTSGVIWRDFAGDGSSGYGFEFDTDQSGEKFDYNELFIEYASCSLVSGTKTSTGALFQSMINNVVYWSSFSVTLPLFVAKTGSTTDGWVLITDIKGTGRHCVFGSYKEGFSAVLPNVQTWREPVTAIKAYDGSIKAVCLMVSSILGFAPGSKFNIYGRK